MTNSLAPIVRRYYLPNFRPLEGWAEVVITSGGFFATVSDYGNYAYAWRHFGDGDFRSFLLNAERDVDYFTKKLQPGGDGPGDVYDSGATALAIKEHILDRRRGGSWTRERARREWGIVKDCDDVWSIHDFGEWYRRTSIDDASEFACYRRNPQAKAFVERVLVARLCPIFRAELEAERSATAKDGGA